MKHIFLTLIRFYRSAVSPFLGSRCRFFPTCSDYSQQAFTKKGTVKGFLLTVARLLKCQPFHPGGFDPVE